ncbi:hypothetical protein RclHR1_00470021 [Rhizophagus clarus]|uniref:DUF659 domain-containing protein n=1 Tax=Rhizophagus clarus TaxID=94130 RepID=A0A2Z6RK96_9GLOM|nr:hypothetical protein RclHR1_00470021 [Rhizophagus clarus]
MNYTRKIHSSQDKIKLKFQGLSINKPKLLLNEEISRVNKKIKSELEIADSLTSLDVALRNYSMELHTGEFLASEISDIIEKIGLDKFTAVVTDNASNSADLVDIKEFIANCEMITGFFNNSHQGSAILAQADSILRARPVFDWILLEHNGIVTNSNVYLLIQDEEFFTNCHHIRSIWAPIKECINILEAKSASLADCFMQMIKLAVAIFRLPSSNPFKTQQFRFLIIVILSLGLNDEGFRNAAITATTLWQNLGYSEQECRELLTQFRKYDQKLKSYDLPYEKNMDTPELCIKTELSYYGKHLDEAELRKVANTGEIIALDDNDNKTNYLLLAEDQVV